MRPGIYPFSKFILITALFILQLCTIGFAQRQNSLTIKKSGAGEYWQQVVDYDIAVTLDNDGRTISGAQTVHYTNNSPDTLPVLYLKAFPNSARKGSLMDLRRRDAEDYSLQDSDPEHWGSLTISNVTGRSKKALDFELDDTIYKVTLNHPLLPGATARIDLEFVSVLPVGIGARHEYVAGQTKAAYWYPQACVYDRKLGWVNSPYIGRGECYGDFGDFTVSITAPEDRVVTATGLLTNQKQALPDTLREMLDITQFVGPRDTWPEFDFDENKTRTWNFFAKKVNDFAWVAGSDFCIDETTHNGVKIEIYPKRSKAKHWTGAKRLAIESLETFSEYYGDYGWPAIKVTDSYDGMEYPMITFCSGDETTPYFFHLVYHEIGHFWFMGLVGSNQTDRPCLDEGFTTMAEIVAMEKYRGRKGNNVNWSDNWYKRNFYPLDEDRDDRGYRIYLPWAKAGYDLPMVISSDNASEYWAYRNSSYYKPVMMHFTLRATYGDALYFNAMHRYGTKWRFKHPYEDDFVESFASSVDERLDEYFEQWFRSRKQIDYAYEGHKKLEGDKYSVTVSKPGDFVTPIDVALISKTGDTVFYTINPEDHDYIKPGYENAGTWPQYRRPSRKYTFEATVPGGIKQGVIDPTESLPDVNRLNNSSGFFPPIETKFDAMLYDVPSMHRYSIRWRPDFWYDDANGPILGLHTHGSYIKTDYKFSLDAAIGIESGRPLIDFKVSHPFRQLGKLGFYEGRILRTDYRTYGKIGIVKEYRARWTGPDYLRFELSGNYSNVDGDDHFRLAGSVRTISPDAAEFIQQGNWNDQNSTWLGLSFRNAQETRRVMWQGNSSAKFVATNYTDNSGPSFTQLSTSQTITLRISREMSLTVNYSRYGTSGNTWAMNQAFLFHPSRQTPLDSYLSSGLFRSPGTFPIEWRDDVYLDKGFGVRGYQDRALYAHDGRDMSVLIRGIEIVRILPVKEIPLVGRYIARFSTEFFAQSTHMYNWVNFPFAGYETQRDTDDLMNYTSAGISFVSPSVWNGQQVRFDFPLYLSRPLPGEDKWDFRVSAAWILPLPTAKWVR